MAMKILFVCLGNICRSPAAEAVFLHKIRQKGLESEYIVDSAGTGPWHVGNSADARMKSAAKRRGINLVSIARQVKLDDFLYFDLMLTMDSDNHKSLESLSKTLNQDSNALVKPLLSYSKKTSILNVPDPYYGGDAGFENVLDLLDDACDGLLCDLIANK